MSTEFNYVARLDTSQLMSGLSEIRSQVGMALGGAGGFGGGAMSATDFVGGAGAGMSQMMASMGGGGMGGTWTSSAISNIPHYGMRGAVSNLEMEGLLASPQGFAQLQGMAPPGVSGGEFAFAVARNKIDRTIQAQTEADLAAEATVATNIAGGIGGYAGSMLGKGIGLLTRRPGLGAALSMGLGMLGYELGGSGMEEKYAKINQERGIIREMGEIVGSGRNLNRAQQLELGIAATSAARDIKMDVNQMGDIMALSRESGLLPSSTDPSKFRQQASEYANAVRDVSQTLHTSLAEATQVIQNAKQKGLSLEQAMLNGTGAGGGGGMGSMMYSMGAATGRSMMFTGAQGGQIFSGAVGQALGSGISGEEMRILGGSMGVASLIGGVQLQAASSGLGTMQLMAAQSGQALGGIQDLPGQALAAMAQGGDMVSNVGKFMVHQDEYKRGIGSKGIRTMARHQLDSVAEMVSDLMPDMNKNESRRFAAMQLHGLNATQAEAYVGGLYRSPGGGGGPSAKERQAAKIAALAASSQEGQVAAGLDKIETPSAPPGFSIGGFTTTGIMVGAQLGNGVGAAIGGGIGLIADNYKAIGHGIGRMLDGLVSSARGVSEDSTDAALRIERAAAQKYDSTLQEMYSKTGYFEFDQDMAARALTADLSKTALTFDPGSSRAVGMTEAAFTAVGIKPVAAGPGTIQVGGSSFAIADVQRVVTGGIGGKKLTKKQLQDARVTAYKTLIDPEGAARFEKAAGMTVSDASEKAKEYMKILEGEVKLDPNSPEYDQAAEGLVGLINKAVESMPEKTAEEREIKAQMRASMQEKGALSPQGMIAPVIKTLTGKDTQKLNTESLLRITRGLAQAGQGRFAEKGLQVARVMAAGAGTLDSSSVYAYEQFQKSDQFTEWYGKYTAGKFKDEADASKALQDAGMQFEATRPIDTEIEALVDTEIKVRFPAGTKLKEAQRLIVRADVEKHFQKRRIDPKKLSTTRQVAASPGLVESGESVEDFAKRVTRAGLVDDRVFYGAGGAGSLREEMKDPRVAEQAFQKNAEATRAFLQKGILGMFGGDEVFDKRLQKEGLTRALEDVKGDEGKGKIGQLKPGGGGSTAKTRAIGFGEQEQVMSNLLRTSTSLNKTASRTSTQVEALHKRMESVIKANGLKET